MPGQIILVPDLYTLGRRLGVGIFASAVIPVGGVDQRVLQGQLFSG